MVDDKPQRRKWIMRLVLAVSLGLNLLFVGAFAGAAYRGAGGAGARNGEGTGLRGYAAPYVQALPRDKRRALFQALRDNRAGAAPLSRNARRALYQQMVSVLRATPFDPAEAEQVLGAQRDAVLGVHSTAQLIWLEEVTEMTPDERASYADDLEKVLARGPRRRDRPNKRDR
ncbi:periplasmic heavy metal sensor [Sulfitobacter sp. SK011]|uniref:periplasmic heavy metal sensor n=1 Tax=Sulfitobacter sp. SK011 TaxID=1389004 RepID=UPI0020C7DE94|nr:periplasmic heavy metal sensor [Sulfitobacter sp. SK011]